MISIYKLKKNHTFSKAFFALSLLFSLNLTLHSQPVSVINQTRRILTQRIDSLDLEKQVLKRRGQSVAEIENRQKELIDSLNSIRKIVQKEASERPTAVKRLPENHFPFLKPQGYFDWLILLVASIAAISGLILIIGIVKTFSVKKKKPKDRIGFKAAQTYSQMKQFQLPENSSAGAGQVDNPDPLHSLRKRISEEQKQEKETPPPLFSEKHAPTSGSSTDIESLVIKAASEGLDIQEISRRLHVSAGQVALILKVMNKSRPK